MKAVVNDKKNLTFVSHLNGVTIVESSGFIIDLDYQCLTSICEISDIGNNYSIAESNRISELEKTISELEADVANKSTQISKLSSELNLRARVINEKNEEIEQLKSDIIKLQADIANFQACAANVSDIEYELNKYRETNNALTEKLESKTVDLLDKASLYKYYRRAFRTVKEYLKPNEQYGFDSSGYNIINSINSKFIISFKDRSIASRAFNELRYSVSPRNVLVKYQKDIIEYNVDSMNIYFVENNTPNVVRKFHDESFSITCKDSYTAEIINILLNCRFDIRGIMTAYKLYIVFSNIN